MMAVEDQCDGRPVYWAMGIVAAPPGRRGRSATGKTSRASHRRCVQAPAARSRSRCCVPENPSHDPGRQVETPAKALAAQGPGTEGPRQSLASPAPASESSWKPGPAIPPASRQFQVPVVTKPRKVLGKLKSSLRLFAPWHCQWHFKLKSNWGPWYFWDFAGY